MMHKIHSAIVTGGTGVTGNALIRYLLKNEVQVTALVRPKSIRRKYLPDENLLFNIIYCAMEDYHSSVQLLNNKSYDVFFHLAWEGSMGSHKIDNRNNFKLQSQNIIYAIDAVELCHAISCPVFIMTGSQAEYGRKDNIITEKTEKKPENGYGMAKLCAESMTRLLCKSYGIQHIWPILFSVYGPFDSTQSLVDITIKKLLQGEEVAYTSGEQEWDYLYSYDAAKALMLLAQKGKDGETYNVANGRTYALRDYIRAIYHIVAPDKTPKLGEIPYNSQQLMFLRADIAKLKKDTNFVPDYSFRQGINEIYESILFSVK
ncbi:NAD-dependent epimerase/dehydratase family protein [Megasphaera sueciensis]|uniref:NAD-dependent epimerase/dehydratase family protein n=1 Tax=Megasphaera sueciensis TaxID=349094 RepID=UPI003D01C149